MKIRFHSDAGPLAALAFFVLIILTPLAAWVTHIFWIISTLASSAGATVGQMVLGGIGAFMPPVGVVHGIMIWFGIGF